MPADVKRPEAALLGMLGNSDPLLSLPIAVPHPRPRPSHGPQHLRSRNQPAGRRHEQRAHRLGQAQRAAQQHGGVLAGSAVDAPLQVTDRPRAQARRLRQLLLRQPGLGPQLVSAYAVSKAAVIKLTENLAVELKGTGVTAFSAHPGLLPIGLSEPALASTPPQDPAQGKIFSWLRRELADGHGADPDAAASFVLRPASGDCDQLSGRHLSVHDDLDALVENADTINHQDLYTLRRREFLQ